MRLRIRAAGFLALAVVAITCTESTTGPRSGTGGAPIASRIGLTPQFTPSAARAYQALAAGGTTITDVHVHLVGADGTVRDTIIPFPVGQDSLTIEIPVTAAQDDEAFTALLELRTSDGTVLFSGTQVVVARAANLPPLTPPVVTITYSGPGKRARTVAVSPPDTTVIGVFQQGFASLPYSATAIDSSNAPVTSLLVQWATSDATVATISATGSSSATVQPTGKRGIATLSATTPLGIVGTSKLTVIPPATQLVVISGAGQTGVAGNPTPQPFVVEVRASDNLPVPGTTVTFAAITAGGSVVPSTVVADASGRASASLTLGKTAGAYQYSATIGGAPGFTASVTVGETATAAPATALALVSGDGQTDSTARQLALPLIVKATDAFGGAAAGATVTWTRVSGSGALGSTTTTTAADGTTSTTYTLGNVVGPDVVTATVSGITAPVGTVTFTLHTIARNAGAVTIVSGTGQSAIPGAVLPTPIVARVADVNGNPVAGQFVVWSATDNTVVFTPPSSTTQANGLASTTVTMGHAVGLVTITAAAGTATASTTVAVTAGLAAKLALVTQPAATATSGVLLAPQPVLQVTDANGNPVSTAGISIVAAIATGGGTLGGTTTVATNASGIATFTTLSITGAAGARTLSFASGALTGVTSGSITLGAGVASTIALNAGNNQSATAGTPVAVAPSVLVTDVNNNPVAGTVVTFTAVTAGSQVANSATNGSTVTVTTNAQGVAALTSWTLGSLAQTDTLTATAAGLTGSPVTFTGTAVAGTGSTFLVTGPGSTITVGATNTPITIQIADAQGNPVATPNVIVTATVTVQPGNVTVNIIGSTNAAGSVTFPTNYNGTIGTAVISVTSAGFTPYTSPSIQILTGAASKLVFSTQPPATGQSGVPISPQPVVQVADVGGNPVSLAGATITVTAINNGSVVAGSTTAVTNANGAAAFTTLTDIGVPGPHGLSFDTPGLTGVTTLLTLSVGPPTSMTILAGNNQSAAVNTAVGIQPTVRVTDAANTPVSGVVVTFTAVTAGAQVSNGTTTGTSVTVTTNAGGNAALAQWILGPTVQSYTLTATSAGLPTASFSATAVAGSGSQLAFIVPPPATATNGTPLSAQPAVQLKDALGNSVTIPGLTVNAVIASGSGTVTNATAITNAAGTATFAGLAINGLVGNYTLGFNTPGYTSLTSSVIVLSAGPPTTLALNAGNNQVAAAGTTVASAPAVRITDAGGNPVSGIFVTFTAQGTNGAQVSNGTTSGAQVTVSTNAAGIAQLASWTLGTLAGPQSLQATAAVVNGSPFTFNATATAGPASSIAVLFGNNQSANVGSAVPIAPSVVVRDAFANAIVGAVVQFSAVTAGSSVSNASTTASSVTVATSGSGVAQLNAWTLGTTAGTYSMTASLPGVSGSPVTFTASATAATGSQLVLVSAPQATEQSGVAMTAPPVIGLRDAFGNTVNTPGVPINVSIISGSGGVTNASALTNTSGLATFANLTITGSAGNFLLQFGSAGYTSVNAQVSVTAGSASQIVANGGNNQSAQSGQPVGTPPSVKITDASGNPVAGVVVTFSAVTAGGLVQNASTSGSSLTVTSNVSGIAALVNFYVGSIAQTYTLTASAPGISGSPVTFTETGTSGQATQLVFISAPASAGTDGVALPGQPIVQVEDAAGNAVLINGVPVTASIVSGTGTLTNATVNTNIQGRAVFTALTITGQAPSAYTLSFSSPGNPWTAASATVNLAVGSPTALVVATVGSTTATDGLPLAAAPVIRLRDVGGNNAPVSGVNVTASIVSGAGSLTNATVGTDATGAATFTGITITGTIGNFTLAYSASGVSTINSPSPITLAIGAASSIGVSAGSGQTVTANDYTPVAPAVIVTDVGGNPVSGKVVTFAAITSGSQIQNSNTCCNNLPVTTNASGVAALFSWMLSSTPGTNTLTATLAGVSGSPLSITAAGVASNGNSNSIVTQPSNPNTNGVVFATQPAVKLANPAGGGIANVPVTVFIRYQLGGSSGTLSGTTTVNTNASGVATFAGLKITGAGFYTLEFSSPGYGSVTSSVTVQ